MAAAALAAGCAHPGGDWNRAAAARYLDSRASQWLSWGPAARAHGTVCISCHTTLPYLMARQLLPQPGLPTPERRLLADVQERVRAGPGAAPWYPGQAAASRGTEAVLNALILADEDARAGHLSTLAAAALERMWAQQLTSGPEAGSWPWIGFDNEPWEAPDSRYYGAALAALAAATAPDDYLARPPVQERLQLLRNYLTRAYPDQMLLNRITLLWAAGRMPQLMAPDVRRSLIAQIWAQQRADGGWCLASLMPRWARRDGGRQSSDSDGFATAFVVLALRQSGVAPADARLQRGLSWLAAHQNRWRGDWSADSPNHRHGYWDTTRHFMDDAATAFAVMALSGQSQGNPRPTPVQSLGKARTAATPRPG